MLFRSLVEAYSALGLRPGAGQVEVEQAYAASLRRLQLQMVPGMPLATRRRAQDQILKLAAAFEQVKNATTTPASSARRRPVPKTKPAGRYAGAPRPASQPALRPVFTVRRLVVAVGAVAVVVVAIVVLRVVLSPVHSMTPATASETTIRATAPAARSKAARLRVLSVPWSYVEVNGRPLGPSGQVNAFIVQPGDCQLVLRQGDRVFPVTVAVQENCETTVYVQLEKGQFHVSHKKIHFAHD